VPIDWHFFLRATVISARSYRRFAAGATSAAINFATCDRQVIERDSLLRRPVSGKSLPMAVLSQRAQIDRG